MTAGFDLESSLVCEGIIGDGCGGGRIFFVEDEKLQVYDPFSKETMVLLENINSAVSLSKSACIVTVTTKNSIINYDLSLMRCVK